LGRRDRFVITGELYRDLPEEAKQEFTDLAQSVTVGERSDVYEFSAGAPGDRNMDLKIHEMQLIKLESASFRAAVQPALQRREPSVLITQPILIVVDLQQDFAGDRALAVQDAEKIAELHYSLARDAISAGFEVVVTRDWHPADHFSFKKKWPEHCVAGGDGARFIPQFRFDDLQERALVVDIGATNKRRTTVLITTASYRISWRIVPLSKYWSAASHWSTVFSPRASHRSPIRAGS
jgi:hypothetical protein